MKRIMAFDRQGGPLFDMDDRIVSAVRTENLNADRSLEVVTTQRLEEGVRILVQDGTLKWREWVVDEPDELHDGKGRPLGTYGCTWSMQYDLATAYGGELWPGTYEPITAQRALQIVLATQTAWEVGTVNVTGTAGTSLYDGSVWEYLGKLMEVWGGEMEPRIVVDETGVTHRYVDWLAHIGSTVATRRFDYGEDCTSIRRKPAPGPRCCRIVPRGGQDTTDAEGIAYSERVGVEEEPSSSGDGWVHDAGSRWVRDPAAEADFRVPDGRGGWRYPEKVVIYDTTDPEELLRLASEDIHKHTRPQTTYEAEVTQFAAAGLDPHGVQLGDEIQVVDRAFGDEPLRMQARVVGVTVNELDESDTSLVIGELGRGLEYAFGSMRSAIDATDMRTRRLEAGGTSEYLKRLIGRLNEEINATGGYTYITEGQGLRTYDRAVSDPLVGAEATKVVEIKGGSIRIANSRKPNGDWDWKSVFVSGHIAAELVTAANITTGYIGSAASGNFWNLDTGQLQMAASTTIGGKTAATIASDAVNAQTQQSIFNKLTNNGQTQGIYLQDGRLYINGSYIQTGTIDASRATITNIDASNIKTGTLDGSKATITNISASNITSGTLDASRATITNINASNITSGTLSADRVNADNLKISRLVNSDGEPYAFVYERTNGSSLKIQDNSSTHYTEIQSYRYSGSDVSMLTVGSDGGYVETSVYEGKPEIRVSKSPYYIEIVARDTSAYVRLHESYNQSDSIELYISGSTGPSLTVGNPTGENVRITPSYISLRNSAGTTKYITATS